MKDWSTHIERQPDVLYGKPIIKGTRVPVDLVKEKFSQGESIEDLLAAYPTLTEEDILACINFPE